jgi:hypothetical protein
LTEEEYNTLKTKIVDLWDNKGSMPPQKYYGPNTFVAKYFTGGCYTRTGQTHRV